MMPFFVHWMSVCFLLLMIHWTWYPLNSAFDCLCSILSEVRGSLGCVRERAAWQERGGQLGE